MKWFDPRSSASAITWPLLSSIALAQGRLDPVEVKVPTVRAAVEDIKTEWTPTKTPGESAPEAAPSWWPPSESSGERRGGVLPAPLRGTATPDFEGRVLFDEPGDGALWAKGGERYKARFDRRGSVYIPFFGSDAPRNYPLNLTLEEVLVGEKLVEFRRDVEPERLGEAVLYDRGSLIEHYDVRPDALEQLFHFDALPRGGDLVLRIAGQSDLELTETPEGFELSNSYGRMFYGRAVVVDSAGLRVPAPTTFADGWIEIRVMEEFLEVAAWPITIDPVILTFVVVPAQDRVASMPDVAYDETTDVWAIVWTQRFSLTDYDVYSELRQGDGALVPLSEVLIDFTADCWQGSRIANNQIADQFLIVAQASANCESPWTIKGRTRQAGSNTVGSQFEISVGFVGDKLRPDVGGDPVTTGPTYYCVVWQRAFSASDHDIHYQLVAADSTLLFPSTQIVDNSSGTFDRTPAISKSNGQRPFASQQWNVVWQRLVSPGDGDIHGAQIHWNGTLTTPTFTVESSAASDYAPQVSSLLNGGSGPRPYLVVYSRDGTGGNSKIHCTALRGGIPLTPSASLTSLEGGATGFQMTAAVESDGTTFTVAYGETVLGPTSYDVFVSSFALSLATGSLVPTEVRQVLTASSEWDAFVRLASKQGGTDGLPGSPQRHMAVWTSSSPGGVMVGVGGGIYDSGSDPGAPYCFGGGTCPCGNPGGRQEGCRNSTGSGAALHGSGSNRMSSANLVLGATQLPPGQPSLFFQGNNGVNNGNGVPFGNGLRCSGGSLVRLQIVLPDVLGQASTSIDIPAAGGVTPGDVRRYQCWYRDPTAPTPCNGGHNLTNGYEVAWTF